MSNFCYKKAKLVMIHETQYGAGKYPNRDNKSLNMLLNSSADGFVLIPKYEDKENVNIKSIASEMGGSEDISISNKAKNMVDSLKEIAIKIRERTDSKKIWIGLPQIDTNSYPKNSNNKEHGSHEFSAKYYCDVLMSYLEYVKDTFVKVGLWDNVVGFYYNQEQIYGDFNSSAMLVCPEYVLMSTIGQCVHDSTLDIAQYSGRTRESVEIKKDFIWMPYVVAYSKELEDIDNRNREAYEKIAYIVENRQIFDAAMIQANLVGIHDNMEEIEDSYFYDKYADDKSNNPALTHSVFKEAIKRGIKNIAAIHHAATYGEFVYPDTGESVVKNKNPNTKGFCKIGAVYELNGDHEFEIKRGKDSKGNEYTIYDNKLGDLTLFEPYKVYNDLIDSAPVVFYWGATQTNSYICTVAEINKIYDYDNGFNMKEITMGPSRNKYSNIIFKIYFDLLKINFASREYGSVTLNFPDEEYLERNANDIAETIRAMFLADNPDMFWIKKMSYNIECKNGYIDKITYTVTPKSDDEEGNIYSFNSNVNSILGSLDIASISELQALSISEEEDNFIKIYNWLVTNVTYTDSTENIYYDCAYGAISPSIRKANAKGFSDALSVLCKTAGIPCLVVKGYKDGLTHYWNYVLLNNAWWFVDAALSVPTSTDPYKYKYFLRNKPSSYMISGYFPNFPDNNGSYIKYGDVDGDDTISSLDSGMALQHALNPSFDIGLKGLIAADVTGSGTVTEEDSQEIRKKALNSAYKLPIESKIENTYI